MNTADPLRSLNRYKKTRRFRGRRAITPMRHRGRHRSARTRNNHKDKVDGRLQLLQPTDALHEGEREDADKKEHREDQGREGDKNGVVEGEWKDTEICETIDLSGSQVHTEVSIHPGSIQELRNVSAVITESNETCPEEEEPPF